MNMRRMILALPLVIIAAAACGKKDTQKATDATTPTTPTTGGGASVSTLSGQLVLSGNNLTLTENSFAFTDVAAQTTATSLKSLQYYISSVTICKEVTMNGTGYNGTSGCLTIYSNNVETAAYDNYSIAEAKADTNPDHYIDFMTVDGRLKLASQSVTLTAEHAGLYKYGLVNFMRPIKIKAEYYDAANNLLFRTKDSTSLVSGTVDGRTTQIPLTGDTTTGEAELLTLMNNNGGTVFPFARPFEITAEDIANNTNFVVDFVFNPANFSTASKMQGCSAPTSVAYNTAPIDVANCVYFDVPMGKLSPVPHKASDTIAKEVYLVDKGASAGKIRIELYYNSADTNKTILGVDISSVNPAPSSAAVTNIAASNVTEEAEIVSFFGYNTVSGALDFKTLSGLKRGQGGTANVYCQYTGTGCVDSAYTYTYEGIGGVTVD